MQSKYTVGIRCSTYNQKQYIEQTLNGFVIQKTSFPFVAMIVDDASTDGQQDVILSYIKSNFDTSDETFYRKETDYAEVLFARHLTNRNCYFAVLFLKENHYQKDLHYKKLEYLTEWRNNMTYEALCEGDDWWIDPDKLQKQVDFLDSHQDYVMCTTSYSSFVMRDGQIRKGIDGGDGKDISLRNLMKKNTIGTLTVMYRMQVLNQYEKVVRPHIPKFQMGDVPLWLFIASKGKIHELPCTTAMYRVLDSSASHSRDFDRQYRFFIEASRVRFWMNKFLKTHYAGMIWFRLLIDTRHFCRRWAKNNGESRISLWKKAIRILKASEL